MNLIDILNSIINIKGEMRTILSEGEDISRYPTAIHNFLVDSYNEGYNRGYSEKYFQVQGIERWVDGPLERVDFIPYSPGEYDPFTLGGLISIMGDVLSSREGMRDEMEILSDDFVEYPSILLNVISLWNSTGYNDGISQAEEELAPAERPAPASITVSDNIFYLSMTDPDPRTSIFYRIGVDGAKVRYNGDGVRFAEDIRVYYWVERGRVTSYDPSIEEPPYQDCEYSTAGEIVDINPPLLHQKSNNTVIIDNNNSGVVNVEYSVDGSAWSEYVDPIVINDGETITISARTYTPNQVSQTNTSTFTYISPEEEVVLPSAPKVIAVQDEDDNSITLSLETSADVEIKYSLSGAEGVYQTYSSPFIISEHTVVWTYSSDGETNYKDSDKSVWIFDPVLQSSAPLAPVFNLNYGGGLDIIARTVGSEVYYRIGSIGDFIASGSSHVLIYPTQDDIIYAYTVKGGVESEWADPYNYNYYSEYYNLPAPTATLINNRIVISSPYSITYTLDGSDPMNGSFYTTINDGFTGIAITETTRLRAVAYTVDPDSYKVHYSRNECDEVFTPVESSDSGFLPTAEYFWIQGASEIRLLGSSVTYPLLYSSNKRDWTECGSVTTGLDRDVKYYLKINSGAGNGFKLFTSIRFGSGDTVTVGGNIVSTTNNGDFSTITTPARTQMLSYYFKDCVELVDASELVIPYTSTLGLDCIEMFSGCSALVTAPRRLYFKTVSRNTCNGMFKGCSSLLNSPSFEFNSIDESGCEEMFSGCSSLINSGIFYLSYTAKKGMKNTFNGCSSLFTVSLTVNDSFDGSENFYQTFKNCVSLINRDWINNNVYVNNIRITSTSHTPYSFYGMFDGCSSLESFGSLPATDGDVSSYSRMFAGCSALEEFGTISLTSVSERTCAEMFENCVSLSSAPVLSTVSLYNSCYERMFVGCSRLKYIKALFLTTPSDSYTKNWVLGVSDTGTFVQDDDASWYVLGVNAIPVGWSVQKSENAPGEITSVSINYDQVSISASNGNDIYYQINGTADEWIKYNGPFVLDSNCIIFAKCVNNHGSSGRVYESEYLEITLPEIEIVAQDNIVSLLSPANYNYTNIYYCLLDTPSRNVIQDWRLYEGEFSILGNCTVVVYGIRANGTAGPEVSRDLIFGISEPSVDCENNIVTISCSTPNIANISYSFDGETWSGYNNPFLINADSDIYVRIRIIDEYSGRTVSYDFGPYSCFYDAGGSSYVILTPYFERNPSNSNRFFLRWPSGVSNGIRGNAEYKIDSGEWSEYNDIGITISADCVLSARAEYEGEYSSVWSESVEYIPDAGTIPPAPVIDVYADPEYLGMNYLKITCSDPNASIYYRYTNVNPASADQGNWYGSNSNSILKYVNSNINSATIEAIAMNGYNISATTTYNYTKSGGTIITAPLPPVISYNVQTHLVQISTTESGVRIFYSFDDINYSLYTGSFNIPVTKTVYAYCSKDNVNSRVVQKNCPVYSVTAPSISYNNNKITMTSSESGATIYYSINNNNVNTRYPIAGINYYETCTVYAQVRTNNGYSDIVSSYIEYIPAPSINYFNNTITLTVSGDEVIKYSFDGGSSWITYTEPVEISSSVNVLFKSVGASSKESDIRSQYCEYNAEPQPEGLNKPLTFDIYSDGTIRWGWTYSTIYEPNGFHPGVETPIQYKINGSEWRNIVDDNCEISVHAGDTVSFSFNATRDWGYYDDIKFITGNVSFDVSGNIMSLIKSDNFNSLTSLDGYPGITPKLFMNCTNLLHAHNLYLPATEFGLYGSVYLEMFANCSSLLSAPSLPALDLGAVTDGYPSNQYQGMFVNCVSLTTAPDLPATTISRSSYAGMFSGCSALVNAPTISATNLAENCFSHMFEGCTALVNPPSMNISVSVYPRGCFDSMFNGCSSLSSIPNIGPASKVEKKACWYMYADCSSLTTAPSLPATTIEDSAYGGMFYRCTSLITPPPALPATTLPSASSVGSGCYYLMFFGCSSLISTPTLSMNNIPANTAVSMFNNCRLINSVRVPATSVISSGITAFLKNTADSGTLEVPSSVASIWSSYSQLPAGWSIVTF